MAGSFTQGLNALHGYIYGRWTPQYIRLLLNFIFPKLKPRGRKWWADRFHCKVVPPEEAKAIITIDKDITRCDLEQIIPYPMARDFVLKAPPDIVVYFKAASPFQSPNQSLNRNQNWKALKNSICLIWKREPVK